MQSAQAKRDMCPDEVMLRDFPFPYRSAIAISNDCEFMSWKAFLDIYRFLCGTNGLDIEMSHSLFFFVTHALCHSTFSYFQGTSDVPSEYAPVIREMIQGGYIDTIHAYGDFDDGSFKRKLAEQVGEECMRHGLTFRAWTNHGSRRNVQNIGHRNLTNYQQGDNPDHPCYHLDLLRPMGVHYWWVDDGYVKTPGDTARLFYDECARDGSQLRLFRRYRGLDGKPAPNASLLPEQILLSDIDSIIAHRRTCVYYQHLGCWRKTVDGAFEANKPPYFSRAGFRVLEYLSQSFHEGKCLVSTVGRLLRYMDVRDSIKFSILNDQILVFSSSGRITCEDLEGITFYARSPEKLRIIWQAENGVQTVLPAKVFLEDESHQGGLGVPWKRLPGFQW